MTEALFPSASQTAVAVGEALRAKNVERADRLISELFGRVIHAVHEVPSAFLGEPGSTGDKRYDALLAVGLAYALSIRDLPPQPWMAAIPPLEKEWLWDGDEEASTEFRALIRRQTPPVFLAKGLLLRDRDVRIR